MTTGLLPILRKINRLRIPSAIAAFLLATLASVTFLSPPAHANGEKYQWVDKDTIKAQDGTYGGSSQEFVRFPFLVYPLTDPPVAVNDGFYNNDQITTPNGCWVMVGIQVNPTDKSKGTLRRTADPLWAGSASHCPADYNISEHFTTSIRLTGADNSDDEPTGTRIKLDIRSLISSSEPYPAETDVITVEKSNGDVIARKTVNSSHAYTEDGFVGFRVRVNVTAGRGEEIFKACSRALELCSTSLSWQSLYAAPLDIHVIEIKEEVDEANSETVCSAGTLGWVICPLIKVMQQVTEGVANLLDGLLRLNPLNESTGGGGIYKIWQSVLNIANIALVVGFLTVIFSQATSFGLSNYGAKRMLPRIIAAAILMNVSFFICQVLVDISNILGAGAAQLVQTVGGASSFSESVTQQTSGLQTAVVASTAIAILIFFLLGPVVLGFLAVFLTVAARYAIIVLLVLVAPLAFAAWVLPNTEQYFKKWWKLFINMLMLYPMVMFVFAAAIIASQAVAAQAQEVSGLEGSVMQIMALVVMALPLFSMPFLFKAAGGVLARIDDMTKRGASKGYGKAKGGYDNSAFGKYRKQKKEQLRGQEITGTYKGKNFLRRTRSRARRAAYDSGALNSLTGGYGQSVLDSAAIRREDAVKRATQLARNNPPLAKAMITYAATGSLDEANKTPGLTEEAGRILRQQVSQGVVTKGVDAARIGVSALGAAGKLTNYDIRKAEKAVVAGAPKGGQRAALDQLAGDIIGSSSEGGMVQHGNWGVDGAGKLQQHAIGGLIPTAGETDEHLAARAVAVDFGKKAFTDIKYTAFRQGTGGREALDYAIKTSDSYRQDAIKALSDTRVAPQIKDEITASLAHLEAGGFVTGSGVTAAARTVETAHYRDPDLGPDGKQKRNAAGELEFIDRNIPV